MDTRTTIFLFLAIFYGVLFGMLGLVPADINRDTLLDQPFLMPDSFLISNCEVFIIADFSQYYRCTSDGNTYEFSSLLITSTNTTHISVESVEQKGFFDWALSNTEWGVQILETFDNFNYRISGMHPVFQFLLWTPLSVMLLWLIFNLIVWALPFFGGGS